MPEELRFRCDVNGVVIVNVDVCFSVYFALIRCCNEYWYSCDLISPLANLAIQCGTLASPLPLPPPLRVAEISSTLQHIPLYEPLDKIQNVRQLKRSTKS